MNLSYITLSQNTHKEYGLKLETQSDTSNLLFNTISDLKFLTAIFIILDIMVFGLSL